MKYPHYVGKRNETIQNTGNITVPEGTRIVWDVITHQTDSVTFINNKKKKCF